MDCSISAPSEASPPTVRFDATERDDALRCVGTPRHKTSMCQWTMLWPRTVECIGVGVHAACAARDAPWFDYKSLHMRCDEDTNQWYVEFSVRRAVFSLLPVVIAILLLFFVILGVILVRIVLWQGKVKKRL